MLLGTSPTAQTITVIIGFIIATVVIRYVLSANLDRSWETDYVDPTTSASPTEHYASTLARRAA